MSQSILDKLLTELEAEEEVKIQAEAQRRGVPVEVIHREKALRQKEVEKIQFAAVRTLENERRTVMDGEYRRRQAYGQRLGLGVAAHNGIVMVIGGLTERSAGNGMSKATVEHVILDDDLDLGRLHRRKGDLLCKPARRLGKRSMGVSGTASAGPDEGLMETGWVEDRVTCKACLAILDRIEKKSESE